MFKPELLSPAGSLEKLIASTSYGADAVYLAGQKFGLRTAAENFTLDELEEGVQFAHARGSKVYTVLNSFLHDEDMLELPEFIRHLSRLNIDGVIASDLGVITSVAKHSSLPIHLSTQASCLNVDSALYWKDLGVHRLILGREASISDAKKIKDATGIEVELFIHGSMCMAYSGNCTISNFTQGRDSNRGGCAQSCRFSYSLEYKNEADSEAETFSNTFFMSSKDLMGIELIPQFFDAQIDSLKIEGRMRSPLYAAMISKIYREAIDVYASNPNDFQNLLKNWRQELDLIPHREYSPGNLAHPASELSVNKQSKKPLETEKYEFIGLIKKIVPDQYLLVEARNPFSAEEPIELVTQKGSPIQFAAKNIQSSTGVKIDRAKQGTLVRIPFIAQAQTGQVLRKHIHT